MKTLLILFSLIVSLGHASADDAQILREARAVVARTLPGKERNALTAALDLLEARLNPEKQNASVKPMPSASPLPIAIVNAVKERAARERPNDHSMQAYEVGNQLNAYDVLSHYETYGAHGVPSDVLSQIIRKAKDSRGTDYSMIVYEIQGEITAYRSK